MLGKCPIKLRHWKFRQFGQFAPVIQKKPFVPVVTVDILDDGRQSFQE
jgi:hypothetical protein